MDANKATKIMTISAVATLAAAPALVVFGQRFAGGIKSKATAKMNKVQAFVNVTNQILN